MSRRRTRIAAGVAVLVLAAAGLLVWAGLRDDPDAPLGAARADRPDHEFALELYRRLANRNPDRNIFCSPLSVSSALAVPCAGARGETAAQMAAALRCGDDLPAYLASRAARRTSLESIAAAGKGAPELMIAERTWIQRGLQILPAYASLLQSAAGLSIGVEDFAGDPAGAAGRIDAWASEKTRGRIPAVIGPGGVDPLTRMVVANAVYLKAGWKTTFVPGFTKPQPFTTSTGEKVSVPTMWQKEWYQFVERSDMEMLDLPYVGERLSMVILLPARADGLPGLEREMISGRLAGWLKVLDAESVREAAVFIPRFEFLARYDLRAALGAMGMQDAFDVEKADFTGIAAGELYLGSVLHGTFVRVDEVGTEATAVTMPFIIANGDEPGVFRADHPFVFLIRDKRTGTILFIGRVTDPGSAQPPGEAR